MSTNLKINTTNRTEEEKAALADRMARLRYEAKYRENKRKEGKKSRTFWVKPEEEVFFRKCIEIIREHNCETPEEVIEFLKSNA